MVECDTCGSNFNDEEEGVSGLFGMVPMAFCQTCYSSIVEMVIKTYPDYFK